MTNRLAAGFLTLLVALSGCSTPPEDADTQPITPTPDEEPELHVVSAEKELTVASAHVTPLYPVIRADGVQDNCARIYGAQESNATKIIATFTPGTGAPDIQEDWALKIELGPIYREWNVMSTGALPLHLELNTTDIPFEDDTFLTVMATILDEEPGAKIDLQGTLRIEVSTYDPEQIEIRTDSRISCS